MAKYFKIADRTMVFEDDGVEMHLSAWKTGTLLQRFLVSADQYKKAMTQVESMGQELNLEEWQAIR